jgi:NADP-dependent 3-hydroxy acid dehydrogenase YdfG
MRLKDKAAIISGAASGIGKDIAIVLLARARRSRLQISIKKRPMQRLARSILAGSAPSAWRWMSQTNSRWRLAPLG